MILWEQAPRVKWTEVRITNVVSMGPVSSPPTRPKKSSIDRPIRRCVKFNVPNIIFIDKNDVIFNRRCDYCLGRSLILNPRMVVRVMLSAKKNSLLRLLIVRG